MSNPPDILQKILARKAEEVAERRARASFAEVEAAARAAGPVRGFARALQERVARSQAAVIAARSADGGAAAGATGMAACGGTAECGSGEAFMGGGRLWIERPGRPATAAGRRGGRGRSGGAPGAP